ncbi:hypothetical protein GQ42DRAFT_83106 [Ramicandelaber brevisporus]|nr:hypothetical protein GQ42DRAFT_83106 [Ramicandelaber brevisporus]
MRLLQPQLQRQVLLVVRLIARSQLGQSYITKHNLAEDWLARLLVDGFSERIVAAIAPHQPGGGSAHKATHREREKEPETERKREIRKQRQIMVPRVLCIVCCAVLCFVCFVCESATATANSNEAIEHTPR